MLNDQYFADNSFKHQNVYRLIKICCLQKRSTFDFCGTLWYCDF